MGLWKLGNTNSGKLIFKAKNKLFEITYNDFKTEDGLCAKDITITENGVPVEEFGESFIGYHYNKDDVLASAIRGYINNDSSYQFIEIPDEIKALKECLYTSEMVVKRREVPKYYYTDELTAVPLVLVTETSSAYTNGDNVFLVSNEDGTLLTDMEPFFSTGIEEMVAEPILFRDKDFIIEMGDCN